jgi:predicted ATPase
MWPLAAAMITKVEASRYRCLREVSQELQPYQILVGPNGSGKSAFLDVIAFLDDVVSLGLKEAVRNRTENFYDLVWGRTESSFRLAIEAARPYAPAEAGKSVTSSRPRLTQTTRS